MKVDIEYTYEFGHADASTLDGLGVWSGEARNVRELRHHAVIGRWECDGSIERYECRTPANALNELRAATKPGLNPGRIEPFELIWDGEVYATHFIKGESVDPRTYLLTVAEEHEKPVRITCTGAPLMWWGLHRFPTLIKAQYPAAQVHRGRAVIAGHATETEVYFNPGPRADRLEIWYDPAVGYLPRYSRISAKSGKDGVVKEFYLVSAKRCAAGGFVPTEWIETSFMVEDFASKYDQMDVDTVVKPTGPKIGLGHYRAITVRDRKTPVRLVRLEGVNTISTDTGRVRLDRAISSLSLEEIKTLVRTRLVPRPLLPPLSRLDVEELHRYDPPRGPSGWMRYGYVAAGALVIILISIGYFARRRRAVIALILIAVNFTGCARTKNPLARLEATFSPSRLVYDSASGAIPTTMVVRNTGNEALKLFRADGGCSCRQVDQAQFPKILKPGETIRLAMRLADRQEYRPQNFGVAFETDHGTLSVPASLLALPRHRISPEGPSHTALYEKDEWTFDLTHREIVSTEDGSTTRLTGPEQFEIREVARQSGRVANAPEFGFIDTTYKVTLRNAELGLHKALINLKENDDWPLVSVPVVWRRVPFLSTIPDRVSLGIQPVRVFLRCPDERVELIRVIAKPAGINAMVSSVRELTVMLDEGAAAIIDGQIEVGTTAIGRPSLKVPVARYAPSARTTALKR